MTAWRVRLDSWRFWTGLAYFALVLVIIGLYIVFGRTSRTLAEQAQADAVRTAERRAAAESSYRRCIESRPSLQAISTHVGGVNDAFAVLIHNSRAVLAATPRSDPQYRVRAANLRRLEAAYSKVTAVRSLPVPSVVECRQRRRDALIGAPGP